MKNVDEKAMQELIDAVTTVTKDTRTPKDIWTPEFGWVLRGGKPTDTTRAFYEKSVLKKTLGEE
jgi:hypothetical protein